RPGIGDRSASTGLPRRRNPARRRRLRPRGDRGLARDRRGNLEEPAVPGPAGPPALAGTRFRSDRMSQLPPNDGEPPAPLRARRAPTPPERLEERVVRSLAARGVVRDPKLPRRSRALELAGLLAAAAVFFWAGRTTAPRPGRTPEPDSTRWMLLLYEDA